MRAVFMPTSYSTSQGVVEVTSLGEVLSLLGIEAEDLDHLEVPGHGTMYLSRSAQHARDTLNRTATFVLKELMPLGIGLHGPVIFARNHFGVFQQEQVQA